eukprot:TRINITY_DN6328_c0_g1_i1.p2 TRINITY_DN6328_c0_g1~~TRINITY_DN6328_c0_g1_i1.p2  ORF type:complete len:269 (+),score=41.32 TRINITY_DN6328_c0_g1_i1:3581-4387(+)
MMQRVLFAVFAIVSVAVAQQFSGSIAFAGSSCTDYSKVTYYSVARLAADGCTANNAGNRYKVDCATFATQTCDSNCQNCTPFPPSASNPNCTTSNACTTCVDNGVTTSVLTLCTTSPTLGVTGSFFQNRRFNDVNCTTDFWSQTAYVANGERCLPASANSARYTCFANGTGILENFDSSDCSGAPNSVVSPPMNTCSGSSTYVCQAPPPPTAAPVGTAAPVATTAPIAPKAPSSSAPVSPKAPGSAAPAIRCVFEVSLIAVGFLAALL